MLKFYPIKWDKQNGQWLLQYVTMNGDVQNVLSPAKIALENYLVDLKRFYKTLKHRTSR